jgi:hypothetical protein
MGFDKTTFIRADIRDRARHTVYQLLIVDPYRLVCARQKVMRTILSKTRIMTQSSADLVVGWQAEIATLKQKISGLRTGVIGHSLTRSQREAAINDQMEGLADFESLILDFSRCESFPIVFTPAQPRMELNIRRFLPVTQPAVELAIA